MTRDFAGLYGASDSPFASGFARSRSHQLHWQHAIATVGIWIATVVAIVLFYFCLGSIFGSVAQVAKQITAFATDAKRLQGQPTRPGSSR
jgi:hypothetical protein